MKKTSSPPDLARRLLSPIDIITVAFCAWILVYMALGWGRAEDPQIHFPTYLSILAAVFLSAWLERRFDGRQGFWVGVLRFLRGLYPVMLFGYFFLSGHSVNRILFGDWIDPFFQRIDQAIFGYLPSLEWGKRYAHWAISELFHFAYFCYYPMIGGLPVYLYFRNRKAFGQLIFTLTFTFYLCYWLYSLLPVIGGRYIPEAMELTKVVAGGPFTRIMALIYIYSAHLGGAFPSSHVGITIVLTIAALKYTKYMGYVFCVIAFFLSLATVYCHYHWFIDAVAGIFIGIIGHFLALFVLEKLQRGQQ